MMLRKKTLALTAALAAFGAQAQTLVTPPEGGETVIAPPEGADTILIVTPADTTATTVQPSQAPLTRDEVRAQARAATQSGSIPRGEHEWADQSRHQQSSASPYDAADSGRPRY